MPRADPAQQLAEQGDGVGPDVGVEAWPASPTRDHADRVGALLADADRLHDAAVGQAAAARRRPR